MRSRQRALAYVAFPTLLGVLVLTVGQIAYANHGARTCSVTPTTVLPGGTLTVTGSTNADEDISVLLGTREIASGDTDTDANTIGHFSEAGQVPSNTTAGSHTVTVNPDTTADLNCGSVTVSSATPTPTARPTATPEDDDSATDQSPSPARTGGARLNVLGDDEFAAGESGRATGVDLTANESYVLDFAQSPGAIIARATANRHGTVRFDFRIPSSARRGRATLTALPADGSGRRAAASITIVSGGSGGGSGGGRSLPATGRDVLVYALFGVLLLLVGLSMQRFEWLRR